jgi:PKD repeat protein
MMKLFKINILVLIIFVLCLCHFACKKVPFYAGEGATLIISAARTTLNTGGDRTWITVIGFNSEGEAMHDHTMVVFSATLGRLEPSEVELMGGRGVVEFITDDRSGVAEIKARSGNITAEPNPLQITIGSAALETLTISANPSKFSVGGGRSHIRAYAFDVNGNLLADIPLVLTASSGSFEKNLPVYMTNAQGMVEDFLQVTENTTVTVASGDKSAQVEIEVEEESENQLPNADFSYSPSSPKRGEKVNFNGSLSSDSDGTIVSWQWDFGDGNTARGERVTHIFNWEGSENQTFSVVLKVTDNRGGEGVTTKSITISTETKNQLPTADFSYSPSSPKKGETVYFNGGLSSDSDGSIVSWQWDFGDGSTANGETVDHAYDWDDNDSRTFSVILKVMDNSGGEAVTSKTVTVTGGEPNQLPTADFSYSPTSPKEGETIYFNASSSSDPDGSIVSWEWDFGDGTTDTGEHVTHSYTWDEGGDKTFTVTLKVTDDRDGEALADKTITVEKEEEENQPPRARFSYSPSAPKKGDPVTFDASSSSDPDGYIVSWEWDFGDDTTDTGEKKNHTFTWPEAGDKEFTVILTVTDNDSRTNTISQKVLVTEF